MTVLKVSKGYQITIPANIRKKFDVHIGSKIDLEVEDNKIILEPFGKPDWQKIYARVKKMPKHDYTVEQLNVFFEKELLRQNCDLK